LKLFAFYAVHCLSAPIIGPQSEPVKEHLTNKETPLDHSGGVSLCQLKKIAKSFIEKIDNHTLQRINGNS